MQHHLNRRSFCATTATLAAGLGLGLGPDEVHSATAFPNSATHPSKALILQKPSEPELLKLKEAGFDGCEAGVLGVDEAQKCRQLASKVGITIHSVLRGWAEFNSKDQSTYDASYALTEKALLAAEAYGASAMLLVPCRIGGMKMPEAWEWMIEFDDKTGHVQRVAYGDNARYADYIQEHNRAVDASRSAVERLIPLAEKTKVVIALENVWNNLWVKPLIFRNFVASFKSPWVKAYFDIGNHVKYAPPEEWILTLGNLIERLHVKDFKLNASDLKGEGDFVNIREGSIRWPVVRNAMEKIGYKGWMTIEGGDLSLSENSTRLDSIIQGK